jgi:ribosomal protein S18 acetylase RimI-like enzyme
MSLAFPSAEALGARFRPTRDEDRQFLVELYASTRWEEVAQTGWPVETRLVFLGQQFELQSIHYAKYRPDAERMVIERDGEPIGRLDVDENADRLHIVDISLAPAARGGGIGTAILDDLQRLARESDRKVSIFVEKQNPALSLYRRLGFVPIREEGAYDFMQWAPPSH